MASWLFNRNWKAISLLTPRLGARLCFRSDAALEAIAKASEEKVPNVVLYNYPSFSGAYSALFAHLFHYRLSLPCIILPFSSIEPFRVEDLYVEGFERCYLLDLLGPQGFIAKLLQRSTCKIICFDHRKKSVLSQVPSIYDHPEKLSVHVDLEKCSSKAAYEYFSRKFAETKSSHLSKGDSVSFLMPEEKDRVETVLTYVEDIDLRRWNLPDIKAFSIGVKQWNSNINCITNPYMYKQLLKISTEGLISSGNSYISYQQIAANKLMDKVFKIRLGRGFYGECLGVKIDGNSNLSDEIGKQLSLKSAAAGLRPIGAVVCMQRKNLKMCLRSTDSTTDTSEVAKAYGGGGSPSSSSFIIRMDEYNQWVSGPAM